MSHSHNATILRVNLTTGEIRTETLDELLYRRYPGGKALASYFLLKELPAGVDPLGPDNLLIFATGLLTGAPLATATRYTVIAKSPLTGGFGESEAGGFWGPELKFAGFEAILITGRASRPVYLWVHDGQAELRDAGHLWGRDTAEVQTAIRDELGDPQIRIAQIGIAGENRVRYAAIVNELRHFNGRSGMGAVMGSKNLRAIAVRGHTSYLSLVNDPVAIRNLGQKLAKAVPEHPLSADLREKGTPGLVDGLNAAGILPTRNFHNGDFDQVDEIKWAVYEKTLLTARRSCYACAVRCKREVAVNDRYQVSPVYGGPEYETLDAFGPNCGIGDLQAIAKANELCSRYCLDSISTGAAIAFAMECFEHGLLTQKETGGIDLRFGNAEAMLQAIEGIARREGIGNLLAEGVRRAAEVIGGDARFFAMHVKGQELPMHDPRGKVGVGLGYAINDGGADHLTAAHDSAFERAGSLQLLSVAPLGILETIPARSLEPAKIRFYYYTEMISALEKSIGFCYFGPVPRSFIPLDDVVAAVHAATGWQTSLWELLKVGERSLNMSRVFNAREGFRRADDWLPDRLFQPLESGRLTGVSINRDDFEQAMTRLYAMKGWEPTTGIPTRAKLEELELSWAADLLGLPQSG